MTVALRTLTIRRLEEGSRFLTPREKRAELAAWARLCSTMAFSDTRGGRGLPDKDIIPWCERINAVPGVCTVQSCAGHVAGDGALSSGHLWLRLDEPMSRAFDHAAFRLARRAECIELVSRMYASWGQEIASITFAGNERDSLGVSMRIVLAFLRSLAADVKRTPIGYGL